MKLLSERDRRKRRRRLDAFYPGTGPLRRELYVKHLSFFRAGKDKSERLMLSANRVGKTEGVGGYELTLHLTGEYPAWWEGHRFDRPVSAWAAGTTAKTVRDIIQKKLLGPKNDIGTGLIPGDSIIQTRPSAGGVPDAIDRVFVKHISGGVSVLTLKSYAEGRKSFEGTEQDVIWEDEEPPLDIHAECLVRTMTTDGLVMCTFTPLAGLSETVLTFLPGGKISEDQKSSNKFVVMATWDDAPHLTRDQKDKLWAAIPPYQREARSKGIPALGSGAIYPVPEDDVAVKDFEIPDHWPKVYGLDVGWNRTSAHWGAWDRESDIVYIYSEHYRGQAEPPIHSEAIKARGKWIPGTIDPASRGRGQKDGEQLLSVYGDLGLDLTPAVNAREAGIYAVWMRLSTGRLKVFKSCQKWFDEFRIYRRDERGQVVKENDHAMDDTRYLIMSGLDIAITEPFETPEVDLYEDYGSQSEAWMGG